MKAITIGVLGSLFFSITYILNRAMELDGGNWMWGASLRYFFMIPLLLIVLGVKKEIFPVLKHIKHKPYQWFALSTIGFGLFYAPLTFAAVYGPGWLVAATFQITIIAGTLLVPFLNRHDKNNKFDIPLKSIFISSIILFGVFIIQFEQVENIAWSTVILSVFPMLIAAFAYPLGNRKMMEVVNGSLNTFQRLFGMTIASMLFWIILSVFALFSYGLSSVNQMIQSFFVALSAGVIATALFFYSTELVQYNYGQLAAVEATQSGAVVFALIGEMFFWSPFA